MKYNLIILNIKIIITYIYYLKFIYYKISLLFCKVNKAFLYNHNLACQFARMQGFPVMNYFS